MRGAECAYCWGDTGLTVMDSSAATSATRFVLVPLSVTAHMLKLQAQMYQGSSCFQSDPTELIKDLQPCILGWNRFMILEEMSQFLSAVVADVLQVHTGSLLCIPTDSLFCLTPLPDPNLAPERLAKLFCIPRAEYDFCSFLLFNSLGSYIVHGMILAQKEFFLFMVIQGLHCERTTLKQQHIQESCSSILN